MEAAQREPVGSHNNGEVTAFEPVSCFTSLLVSILKLGNTFQFHLRLFLYPSFLHSRNICIGPDKSHNLPERKILSSHPKKSSVCFLSASLVSIRPTTGLKPLYTTIATVTMNLIVSAAIVLLNPYVTVYISYKIPPFALSVHIPDVSTSICVEVDSKVLLELPFCDKAFVR